MIAVPLPKSPGHPVPSPKSVTSRKFVCRRERVDQWKALAAAGEWDALVERLLLEHYDPAYTKSISRNFSRIDAAHVVALARSAQGAFTTAAQALVAEIGS